MYGAILGDIIGSPYEFDRGSKTKDFPLFSRHSEFTEDTVMTIAVADAFLPVQPEMEDDAIRQRVIMKMQKYGRLYPHAGYGGRFRRMARLSVEVTHNHPEGIKGAEATASAIFLARTDSTKAEIKAYIEENFRYDLSRTCDEIRPEYYHVESCQETVPEASTAFLEGQSFEDVIRTAVSLGGDCDTLTCIAGSMAEAFYGVPEELKIECRKRLPEDLREVLQRFDEHLH